MPSKPMIAVVYEQGKFSELIPDQELGLLRVHDTCLRDWRFFGDIRPETDRLIGFLNEKPFLNEQPPAHEKCRRNGRQA